MFICMSSGARPRYRQDIILALAMPIASPNEYLNSLKILLKSSPLLWYY